MPSLSGVRRLFSGDPVPADPSSQAHAQAPHGSSLAVLTLGALGVVYGDIGTSPLYALRECFHGAHGIAPTRDNVLGVLSLIFWSLTLIISIKYLVFVMRADNKGEGGILALLALVAQSPDARRRSRATLVALGLFGAALLYGDGMITPAISVLGAVEGLQVATHIFEPYIVPVTVAILFGLFLIQSHGTARVGSLFGPVMIVWFVTIAALGAALDRPGPDRADVLQPAPCRHLLPRQRVARVHRARLRVPRRHGRRGALRRHGALRQEADPARLVRARAARAPPELSGTGGDAADRIPPRPYSRST